jgi:hypothetical protein
VKGIDNKVYDQNNIIYGFREMRDYIETLPEKNRYSSIYDKIRLLAVLQSGLSNSPISFTSVLPYEDFQDIYNNVLGNLKNISNLDDFYSLGVFERNNWNNDDMVPRKRAGYIASIGVYNPAMYFLSDEIQTAVVKKQIPPVITQSINNREGRYDYMVYTWEVNVKLTPEDVKQRLTQAEKKSKMRAQGDYSFIKKGLFRKVVDKNNVPLIHSYTNKNGELVEYYVYKAINAWGDSYRANEFYDVDKQSAIDNGFIKVNDVDNLDIIDLFKGRRKKTVSDKAFKQGVVKSEKVEKTSIKDVQEFDNSNEYDYEPESYDESGYDPYAAYDLGTPTETVNEKPSNVEVVSRYSIADVKANPNKIYVFGDNMIRRGTGGQAQIRNNPNAMGITTKIFPTNDDNAFMSDSDFASNKSFIDKDIAKIKADGRTVVLPKDGLGTGLAKLKEKAPKTYAYLKQKLLEEFGFDNDKGTIIKKGTNKNNPPGLPEIDKTNKTCK